MTALTSRPNRKIIVLLRAPVRFPNLFFGITPGFGDSVRLAERLKARSNPIGWFTSEIWDRLTDKSLWLNQQAIKHVRDKSLVDSLFSERQ
mgnify:CR=1 FL=1